MRATLRLARWMRQLRSSVGAFASHETSRTDCLSLKAGEFVEGTRIYFLTTYSRDFRRRRSCRGAGIRDLYLSGPTCGSERNARCALGYQTADLE